MLSSFLLNILLVILILPVLCTTFPVSGTSFSAALSLNVVEDCGAVGDGIHDDTNAVQSCADQLQNTPGGSLYFPPGSYLLTATLSFGPVGGPYALKGEGLSSALLWAHDNHCMYFQGSPGSVPYIPP